MTSIMCGSKLVRLGIGVENIARDKRIGYLTIDHSIVFKVVAILMCHKFFLKIQSLIKELLK